MLSTYLLHQRTRFVVLTVLLAGVATFALSLSSARAGAKARCKPVGGLLLDEHIEGDVAVARMVGGITGRYTYTLRDSFPADTVRTNLIYITGTSVVAAKGGTLSFFETSTQDTAEPGNLNGTVLMTVVGGTGKWTGATGHVVLVGAFHQDTLTGAWSYVGKVCVP